jgi:hypothetical protein
MGSQGLETEGKSKNIFVRKLDLLKGLFTRTEANDQVSAKANNKSSASEKMSRSAEDCISSYMVSAQISRGEIDGRCSSIRVAQAPKGKDSMLLALEASLSFGTLENDKDLREKAREQVSRNRGIISRGLQGEAEASRFSAENADELKRRAKSGAFEPQDMRHLSRDLEKDIAIAIIGPNGGRSIFLCTSQGRMESVDEGNISRFNKALQGGHAIFVDEMATVAE